MEYPEEHSPTKKVIYLVTRPDGSLHRVDGALSEAKRIYQSQATAPFSTELGVASLGS